MQAKHVLTGFLMSMGFVLIVLAVVLPMMLAEYFFGDVGATVVMLLYMLFILAGIFSYAVMLGDR